MFQLRTSTLCIVIGLAVASGGLNAAEPYLHGIPAPPAIHPGDPHRLAVGGATWVMAGYYPSIGAFSTDTVDKTLYRRMIDAMADRGINYFRIAMTMGQPYGSTATPYVRASYGKAND